MRRIDLENNGERFVAGRNDELPARERARYEYARSVLRFKTGKVLDIGCSSGFGATILQSGEKFIDYVGIDADEKVVDYAKQEFSQHQRDYLVFDINTPEFWQWIETEHFDFIVAFEVLEHLDNGREIAQRLKLYCDILICSVPYREPVGFWGKHHKLHNLERGQFPGMEFKFMSPTGEIQEMPFANAQFNLLLMKWEKQFDDNGSQGVSVVIPHWKNAETTLIPLLESIAKYTDTDTLYYNRKPLGFEVRIMCNGTPADEMEVIKNFVVAQRIGLIIKIFDVSDNGNPIGYTRATNAGIRSSLYSHILLLNNDVVLLEQPVNTWVFHLLRPFYESEEAGVTGTSRVHAPYGLPFFIIGYCLMTTRAVFNSIGGLLDERFNPGGMEDVDLCIRAQHCGYTIHQVPTERRELLPDADNCYRSDFPIFHPGRSSTMNLLDDWQSIFDSNVEKLGAKYGKRNEVTAVVCTRNRSETTLALTLSAIINQTTKPARLLILDQSDENAGWHKAPLYEQLWGMCYNRGIVWEVVWPPKTGQHISHQFSQKDSEIVWRVDDDCIPEPDVLAKLLHILKDHHDVGAVGGRILTSPLPTLAGVPDILRPTGKIADVLWAQNTQWFADTPRGDVEHLHCSFAYRARICNYNPHLSPVAHREETMFTYEFIRAGYRVFFEADAVTWHLKQPSGGIRNGVTDMFRHDENIFKSWAADAGIHFSKPPKIALIEHGLGDNFAFLRALPDIIKKHGSIIVGTGFPELYANIPEITAVPGDVASRMLPPSERDALNVYKVMWDKNWRSTISDAYRTIYGCAMRDSKERYRAPEKPRYHLLKIMFAPYAREIDGQKNAKNFPHWQEVISVLESEGHTVIQVGTPTETPIAREFRPGLSFGELKDLLAECDTFLCVDTWLQHAAALWEPGKQGVVVWSKSNPLIFGYQHNYNIFKMSSTFRERQFANWHEETFDAEAFPSVTNVLNAVWEIGNSPHYRVQLQGKTTPAYLPVRREMIETMYRELCVMPSDINEHLPTLRELADDCETVTEFGTRHGVSTVAFLASRALKVIAYDIEQQADVDKLLELCPKFEFHRANVLNVAIAPTDMLFIDTLHTYGQLRKELKFHADKVRKYLVFHDTTTFGHNDEVPTGVGIKGLNPAIAEFMELGQFRVLKVYENNNGLTVLERI